MINAWLLESIIEERKKANILVNKYILNYELKDKFIEIDFDLIRRVVDVLELALFDMLSSFDSLNRNKIRSLSAELFKMSKILPEPDKPIEKLQFKLKYSCYGVLGDSTPSVSKLLKEKEWDISLLDSQNWKKRTFATIIDVWLRLIRKKGWDDRDTVLDRISKLKKAQKEYEQVFLEESKKKKDGYELIILYHLAAAADKMALYITDGKVNGNFQIQQLLDSHFDKALDICNQVQMLELEPIVRLLEATTKQLVENSIWTVTRAVNSRVTK